MTDADIPLPYRIDLSGLSLIEASAGTGKTHTLVRLMARHLLWHGLPIERSGGDLHRGGLLGIERPATNVSDVGQPVSGA